MPKDVTRGGNGSPEMPPDPTASTAPGDSVPAEPAAGEPAESETLPDAQAPPTRRRAETDEKPLWVVENRTARRIEIHATGSTDLVIPPFGRRWLDEERLRQCEVQGWVNRGLVRVYRGNAGQITFTRAEGALGLVFLVGVVGGIYGLTRTWAGAWSGWIYWGVLGTILAVLTAVSVRGWESVRRSASRIGRAALLWVDRWLGITGVLAVGFGVPTVVVSAELVELGFWELLFGIAGVKLGWLTVLYMTLFVVFVGIVSTLPALLFYLFDRQQMSTVRDSFFREVMRLDPAIQTVDDAMQNYGVELDKAYGGRAGGILLKVSSLPLLISTLLLTFGWMATLLPTVSEITERSTPVDDLVLHSFFLPHQTVFTFGFLGVYFFTLNMLFRRYVRSDLGPKAYSHIAMRVIIAIVLVWVLSAVPVDTDASWAAVSLLILAFLIGVVPETGPAIFHEYIKREQGWIGQLIPSLRESDPLNELEGISLYDRARLLEEGIENVENLAHHDIVDLMLGTRIPTGRIVDLVDQAILYLHCRDATKSVGGTADHDSALARLRRFGVRTATDLEDARLAARGRGEEEAFLELLGSEDGVKRLEVIADTIEGDDWMPHLRHWRAFRETYSRIYTLQDFTDESGSGRTPLDPALPVPAPAPA